MKKNIVVIGGSGQLGQCLNEVVSREEQAFNYLFLSKTELDFVNASEVARLFDHYKPVYCVNCAAYTAVDQAEDDLDRAFELNQFAVKKLAEICLKYQTTLIHISTDFVFDGNSGIPLDEEMHTIPVNIYGLSKLKGEQEIQQIMDKYFIIRTSWLYSEKSDNFVKKMLKIAQRKDQVNVVFDQIGTPTYAMDLARVIIKLIKSEIHAYGLYHYSNEGVASWYDYAKAIFEFAEVDITVLPIPSSAFITRAKRPHYSVLDKAKIKRVMGLEIPYWRDSLNFCIQNL